MRETRRYFSRRELALLPFINDHVAREIGLMENVDVPATGSPAELKARYFSDAEFQTHDGRRVRFYTDLLKGKKVLINFMYRECSETCPRTTANLVAVRRLLGDRVGRDVFFISLSLRPEVDTPAALHAYSVGHGCGPGWTFLTGAIGNVDALRRKLGLVDNPDVTQHLGLLTFGNEPEGRWGTTNALASPDHIVWAVRNRIDGWTNEPWPATPTEGGGR